jgi:hypothetical protein
MANRPGTSGSIRHRIAGKVGTTPQSDPQLGAPIACSLDVGGLRTQEQRWRELVSAAGLDRAATADGVTLTFRADLEVERQLRELVAVESQCCAWAQWEVRSDGDGKGEGDGALVMQARAAGEGVATLQSMFPPGI